MFILGLGTATPPQCYAQEACWRALEKSAPFQRLLPRSRAILKKVLTGDNGIETRHLALNPLEEVFELDPDTLQRRFAHHAPRLAAEAAQEALRQSEVASEEIDAVLVSTCTGYLCPGLTSYVTESLGLRPTVDAFDLAGQGCGAAIPNLTAADALIHSGRARRVLSVCVEVCSAAFYLDDDPGVLISACLFGDGAAAAVLAPDKREGKRRVRWMESRSLHQPEDRDYLRFQHRGGMLRNILAPQVPELAAKGAARVFHEAMDERGIEQASISAWILHAGGRDVLRRLQERFGLREQDVRWSAELLRTHGNLSSPFVLFALKAALEGGAPDGLWWMTAFGAGFSCHGALLEVSSAC